MLSASDYVSFFFTFLCLMRISVFCGFPQVVLYFNDVKEGGETVFTHAPGIDHHLVPDTKVPVREVSALWTERLGLKAPGVHGFCSRRPTGEARFCSC